MKVRLCVFVILLSMLAGCRLAKSGASDESVPLATATAPASADPSQIGGVQICEHYNDSPIPSGYDEHGCWTAMDYFQRAPDVIPDVDATSPVLRIAASGQGPFGIEGTLFFVRVVSPSGRVVLQREWKWPKMEQQVPPGAYQVTAWARTCDGNCDLLDPPVLSCTVDILAEPSMTYTMQYRTGQGTVDCSIALDKNS